MKKTSIIALVGLIAISIFIDSNRHRISLPIIAYPEIAEVGSVAEETVDIKKIEGDFKWLSEYGCGMVLPRDFVNKADVPKYPVMICFDSCQKEFYDQVYPLLKKYNLKAELAVATALADTEGYCTWDQIKEMSESGYVEIGSFGHELYKYEDTGAAAYKGEDFAVFKERSLNDITKSAEILNSKLDAKVYCFTYPYGYYHSDVSSTVKGSFGVSLVSTDRTASVGNSFHKLNRYNITQETVLPVLFGVSK